MLQQLAVMVSQGVPYDVAISMSAVRRLAWLVALGEAKGGRFNWTKYEWEKRDA